MRLRKRDEMPARLAYIEDRTRELEAPLAGSELAPVAADGPDMKDEEES